MNKQLDSTYHSHSSSRNVRDYLQRTVGFVPKDAYGWLYACRGLYELKEYSLVVDGISHCLRHEKTYKEAQHLLAFALLHTHQHVQAANAFFKSVKMGNDTDWQPLVELCIEQPNLPLHLAHSH